MGMYDNVDYDYTCTQCKQQIVTFQTKAGPNLLTTLKPHEVTHFSGYCDCGATFRFKWENNKLTRDLEKEEAWRKWKESKPLERLQEHLKRRY